MHDPITLTPDGLLLDGRNRAHACIMAGVEPVTVVYSGDPWVFSLSRNKHRRHMTEAALALVAAALATKPLGANQHEGAYKKVPSIKEAASAAGIPKTAVEAAKVVLSSGTPEEIASVKSGKKKLTPTANTIRERNRAPVSPKPPTAKAAVDPIDAVACGIIAKCSDGKWWTAPKIATAVKRAPTAVRDALNSLGDCVTQQKNGSEIEYRIERGDEAHLRRSLAAKDQEIAVLKKRIADQDAEIERLTKLLTAAPPRPTASPKKASVSKH